MIFVALGSNLSSPRVGGPLAVVQAALSALESDDLRVIARSRWYRSAPVPVSDQPWYVNGVAQVETGLPPYGLLERLHRIEAEFGRERSVRNAARVLDLDLLAYDGRLVDEPGGLVLPHPRLHERAFVLLPLADLAPDWKHPGLGLTVTEMIERMPEGQQTEPVAEDDGP